MRLLLSIFLIFYLSFSSFSQFWITGVSSSPSPANDCDIITISINGNLSASNCSYVSSFVITGNIITIEINVTCGGIGLPVITPYNESVVIGTIPSNNYVLVVNQYSIGIFQETNTSSLNIGTCCASNANISLLNTSNCIGDPTSFIDLGTIADSLVWTDNGAVFSPNSSALGWIYTFNSSGTHNVILTAIDSTGCSDTNNLVVTVNDLPEILMSSVSATCATCQNGEAYVTVASGPMPHQLVWSVGGILNPLTGLNPGNYVATLTDGNLCSVTDSIIVGNSVSVNENIAENFSIYPNPSSGKISLNIFKNEFNDINFEVYNLSGELIEKKILFGESDKTYIVNLDLINGIYFIKVNNFTKKIVINHFSTPSIN